MSRLSLVQANINGVQSTLFKAFGSDPAANNTLTRVGYIWGVLPNEMRKIYPPNKTLQRTLVVNECRPRVVLSYRL